MAPSSGNREEREVISAVGSFCRLIVNWRFKNIEKDIQGSSRQSSCGEGMASGLLQREWVVCEDALQGNLECHAGGAGLDSVYNWKSRLCAWRECLRAG